MAQRTYMVAAIRNRDQYEVKMRVRAGSAGQAVAKVRPAFKDKFGTDDYHIKTVD